MPYLHNQKDKVFFGWSLQLIFCAALLFSLHAATFFVAPDGDDSKSGTIDEPFATLQKGHDKASAGDTVYLRGGTYVVAKSADRNTGIAITKSGKSDDQRICFFAYADEVPVLDFNKLSLANIGAGIRVQGKWLHFRGLEICNVKAQTGGNNGIWCNPCTHNIFEKLNLHHNEGPGLSIANGEGDLLILNCDSHDNYDKNNRGEDADGFGIHYQKTGDTIVLRGCRAWWNSDDGYDMFEQRFPVLVENCWAYGNGYTNEGKGNGANGSGFKMGNSKVATIRHTIRNCVSWGNKNQGFYANHSPGGTNWYNNTSYKNGVQYDLRSDVKLSGDLLHVLRNNIAFPKGLNYPENGNMEFNSWDLGLNPSAADFVSIDDTGWKGPRKPDGGLPDVPFLKLKEGSAFVDKGTDVGLPFSGKAPDLGAYETGMVTSVDRGELALRQKTVPEGFFRGEADHHYYDLSGKKIISELSGSGVRVLVYKKTSGAPELILSTFGNASSERGKQ